MSIGSTVYPSTSYGPNPGIFCTDEDVFVEAQSDYFDFVARSGVLAQGGDGEIDSVTPWTLTSGTVDFQAQMVPAGALVRIWGQPQTEGSRLLGNEGSGAPSVVVAASGMSLSLRGAGMAAGQGNPPGSPSEDLTGLSFSVVSVFPVILSATKDVARELDVANNDVDDAEARRELIFLKTLQKLYWAGARQAGRSDSFAAKANQYGEQYDRLLGRVHKHKMSAAVGGPIGGNLSNQPYPHCGGYRVGGPWGFY